LGIRNLLFEKFKALDLGAYSRSIGGVERQQRSSFPIAGGLKIGLRKDPGQIWPAVKREVHDKESHVSDWVGEAEPLIELDAINNNKIVRGLAAREEVDMVQAEVTMRISGYALVGS
jgi:hypothetical protein